MEVERPTSYRIVSELLPRSTQRIHEAILEAADRRPEVILEAGSLGAQQRKHSRDSSCTCYQCQEAGFRKHSGSAPLGHDENYNLTELPPGKQPDMVWIFLAGLLRRKEVFDAWQL